MLDMQTKKMNFENFAANATLLTFCHNELKIKLPMKHFFTAKNKSLSKSILWMT